MYNKKSDNRKIVRGKGKDKEKMKIKKKSNTRRKQNRNENLRSNPKNISMNQQQRKIKNNKKRPNLYIIVLILSLLFLLISILVGHKRNDVSKFIYLDNKKIKTINPVKIVNAKNSTAKVAILSLEDIKKNFDNDISFDNDTKEIITTGETHVAQTTLNDFAINLNGTDSVINASAFEENRNIYLPLNDLSSVYGIEIFITNNDIVIVDLIHKEKKLVQIVEDVKLKNNKTFLSRTVDKLNKNEDFVLIKEYKNKLKVRTSNGIYGYISSKKVKSINEIRTDYNENEKINYNFIENFRNPKEDFTKVQKKGEYNAVIADLFNIKDNPFTLSEKFDLQEESYKEYRQKLTDNNIDLFVEINLDKINTELIFNNFENRKKFISEILKNSTKQNLQGILLSFNNDENINKENYEKLIRELKPRLKERGLKLVIQKNEILNENIRKKVDYEF